jgi:uncharacterized protein with ATP-grasp and redox domains
MSPNPLMCSEAGSFAEHTIAVRKPGVVAMVLAENDYPPEIVAALEALRASLPDGPVPALNEAAPDAVFWARELAAFPGGTWRDLSWFVAESYFYRCILDAVDYFVPGPWQGRDPYALQKQAALVEGLAGLANYHRAVSVDLPLEERFRLALRRCLWGNRVGLCNIKVDRDAADELGDDAELLLIDHTAAVWEMVSGGRVVRLDIVADNAGSELISDLSLIDLLLANGLVGLVHLHVKHQPFYVSDTMIPDVEATVAALQASPELSALGARLGACLAAGRLVLHDHPFWTTCLHYRQMPTDLLGTLSLADLILFKGDANYRRLVGDAHWPPTTPLEEVADYLPAPFVTIRTLKAEVVVGLAPGQAEVLAQEDPAWLVNGRRGVIHMVSTYRPLEDL